MIKKKIKKAVSRKAHNSNININIPISSSSKPFQSNRRAALINKGNHQKIIGTPDYIAPEIINQTSVDNKSIDWWSLGVIAY